MIEARDGGDLENRCKKVGSEEFPKLDTGPQLTGCASANWCRPKLASSSSSAAGCSQQHRSTSCMPLRAPDEFQRKSHQATKSSPVSLRLDSSFSLTTETCCTPDTRHDTLSSRFFDLAVSELAWLHLRRICMVQSFASDKRKTLHSTAPGLQLHPPVNGLLSAIPVFLGGVIAAVALP